MAFLLASLPALVLVIILVIAERLRGAPRTDWWRNVQAWMLYAIVGIFVMPLISAWRGPALLDGARLPFWLGFPLFLILKDFGEYLFHRAQHSIPALWAMHSLHHSDPEMATLTTQRHFWGDQLLKQVTIWSVPLMVITPTSAMFFAYGMIGLWNFFTHADLKVDFGWWSWVINSPAYHRRHHSCLPEHYNSNFAGLFPIFDVIFGSYHRPDGFPPTGLAHQPQSLTALIIWPLIWNRPAASEAQASPAISLSAQA